MSFRKNCLRGAALPLLLLAQWSLAQRPEPSDLLDQRGNPNRPQADALSDEPFWMDFEQATLKEVIEALGAKTGRNFFIDPSVGQQTVTVVSHHRVPASMAYEILEALLDAYNLALYETLDGNLVRVAARGPNADKLEITEGDEDPIEGYDRQAIHIVTVKHTDAEDVSQLLQAVGSPQSQLRVYARTNTLVMIDTIHGIRNMLELLEIIDVPGHEISYEIFRLKFSRAEVISGELMEVLGEGDSGGRTARAPAAATPARVRAARAQAGAGQSRTVVGGGEEVLRIVADERLNMLIVVATQSMMDQVRYFIGQLDVQTPFEANNMHYVDLMHADAEKIRDALESLVNATEPRTGGQARGGAQQQGEIQPFERKVFITIFEPNNALLILASPQDFEVLSRLIDKLDQPRKQVSVQAVIMEVTVGDNFALSVDSTYANDKDLFALTQVVNIANVLTSPLSGGTLGVIGPNITFTDPETGISRTVSTVPFIIQAVELLTHAEVLSQPNLLTQDNTPASMIVGQEIPILDTAADINPSSGFQTRGNISRQDVGVKLEVTPQINEGDMVRLEIKVEVSSAVNSSVGVDPNQIGVTLNKSEFTNEVVIGDGHTGIIGGLISETTSRSRSQPPIIGDIPILGWFVRSKTNARAKQNLVVMVTPRILRDPGDMDAVKDALMQQFYRSNLDLVFEEMGFIKKVRKKNWKRKKYSPTQKYNPDAAPESTEFQG